MSDASPAKSSAQDRLAAAIQDPGALGPRFAEFVAQLKRPLVFFDIESTGTEPGFDRIIEICLLRVEPAPKGVQEPKTWRINPGIRIPREATEVHGITNEAVASCPGFAKVADELLAEVEGADLAGFAITRFDLKLLQAEMNRAKKKFDWSQSKLLDAQVIYHRKEPRNLGAALNFYCGHELVDAHGAKADTVATLEVFAGQLERYADLETRMDHLHEVSSSYGSNNFVDPGRRFLWRDGEPTFNFGKLRGKALRRCASDPNDREYLRWILGGNFEDVVKNIVRDALEGKILRREDQA